jgi:hypothetical protein
MKRYVIAIVGVVVMTVLLAAQAGAPVKKSDPVVPKGKTMLWNGKDFAGWKLVVRDPKHDVTETWSVRDGIVHCQGKPSGYMRTEEDYANYLLHVEWRWPGKGGNSGALVHMSIPDNVWPKSLECQLASGNAGDFWLIGEGRKYLRNIETAEHAKGDEVERIRYNLQRRLGGSAGERRPAKRGDQVLDNFRQNLPAKRRDAG